MEQARRRQSRIQWAESEYSTGRVQAQIRLADTDNQTDRIAGRSTRRSVFVRTHALFILFGLACLILPGVLAQSSEEAVLGELTTRFFAAYERQDLDGLMKLWSEKSPDLDRARQGFQQTFAANESVTVKDLEIRRVKVAAEKASVRVTVEISAIDRKTNKPAAGLGKQNRTLSFVNEAGAWKAWRYRSTEEELASEIAEAKTDRQCRELLAAEKGLAAAELGAALINQGNLVGANGNSSQATRLYELALEVAQESNDKAGVARALRTIGMQSFQLGAYTRAMECLEKSLRISEELADKAGIATALNIIGIAYYTRGDYTRAMEYYERSLKITDETDDKVRGARTLNNMGLVQEKLGNYAQAMGYYERSLKIKEGMNDKPGIAAALNNIGLVEEKQGNYTQAMEHYQRSLSMSQELGDKVRIAGTLNNIGMVQHVQGNYIQALEYYERALKIKNEIADQPGIAVTLNNMGITYLLQGNYARAMSCYEKGLEITQKLDDKAGTADILSNIGNIHEMQGNSAQAMDYFQRSLKISEEIKSKGGVAVALMNIGAVHKSHGNYTQAMECYQRSLKIREDIKDKPGISVALNSIGVCIALNATGTVEEKNRSYTEAMGCFQRSLQISREIDDKPGIAAELNNIGNIYLLQGNYSQAAELASQAADINKQIGSQETLLQALTSAGKAYRALNQPDHARRFFADAIDAIESVRSQVAGGEQAKQQFFATKIDPYYLLIDLLVEHNDNAGALDFAERSKSRVLLDVLEAGKVNVSRAMTEQERDLERRLNGALVSLNTQIYREKLGRRPDETRLQQLDSQLQKARLEYEQFQTTLYASHPELSVKRGHMQPISLQQAAELIPNPATALLEFVVADDKTFLFVITERQRSHAGTDSQTAPEKLQLKAYTVKVKQKDLADRAEQLRNRLASRSLSFQPIARELYDLLLGPARQQLQGKTSLIIVPDGPLWEIPFQALQPQTKRYLIQDSAISYAPSLTVLLHMCKPRSNESGPLTLLAFGNPAVTRETADRARSILMDEKLGPLPETERQVKELSQVYGPALSKVYVGAEAREERLKTEAPHYRVLHLATHGVLNDKSPMYSHLVLSQAEGAAEDGLLEAWEIMNLDLKADLVVLSACETARGRMGNGEGIIGLTWALFVAGAPTTVASQWKVETRSTGGLMVAFHRNLRSRMSRAEALRQAALKLLSSPEHSHPFHWAGFIIVGNAR